jgi:hypothetical protein
MTAVLAVLLVLGAVVLCAVAWHTRHLDAPGVPDRENGALTAWDPAELREWTLELHHTKSTPPWPPLPHPDAAAGSQGGGHDWLAAPTPASLSPAAGMVAGENPARLSMGHETPAAGDPVTHDLWDHGPDEWTTRLVPAAEAPAAQDWAAALPPMSERLRQGLRDADDAQRWPELQHGFGFADGTGTFTRIIEDGAV